MSINKVLYNLDQRAQTTDAEKKTARDNIGAEKSGKRGMCWATWHKSWATTPSAAADNPLETYQSLVEAGTSLDSSGTTDESIYIFAGNASDTRYHPILYIRDGRKIKWTWTLEAKWVENSSLWGYNKDTRLLLSDNPNVADNTYGAYPLAWACSITGHKEYDGTPSTNRFVCPSLYKFMSNGDVLTNTKIQFELTVFWEDVTDA